MTEIQTYARTWRRRLAAERSRHRELAAAAHASLQGCARLLVDELGARRVYLFGSLAGQAGRFGPRSDIDLAVEGLAPELHWRALRALADELPPGLEVDLVPLEEAVPSLRRHVLESGELLRERA